MQVLVSAEKDGKHIVCGPFDNFGEIGHTAAALTSQGYSKVVLTRQDVVCDFCSAPGIMCVFQIPPGGEIGPGHMDSDGKWSM